MPRSCHARGSDHVSPWKLRRVGLAGRDRRAHLQLQRAPGLGRELPELRGERERLLADDEVALEGIGAIRPRRRDVEVDRVDLPDRAVVQDCPSVDHAEVARAARGERQDEAAAGERQRRAEVVRLRDPLDLQHRAHQTDLLDLEPATQQGQRLQAEIEPVDLEHVAVGRRAVARERRLRQAQRRSGQQLEVDPAPDRHALSGDRLGPLGHLLAVVVPAHQPGQQQQTASEGDDQQDRKSNNDAQGRRSPEACGARARWSAIGRGTGCGNRPARPRSSPRPGAAHHARGWAR